MPNTTASAPPPGARPREIKHLSYSSMSAWQKCGKSYQLGRVQGIRGTPAWWNIGGNAVHSVLEVWDHFFHEHGAPSWGDAELQSAFTGALESEIDWAAQAEPDRSKWRIKRMSSEGYDWWMENGPRMCQSYIDWRLRSPSWEIWTTPDGEPAIELDVSGYLPGCDMEIKAYLDRVFCNKLFNRLEIVDFKSGSSVGTDLQFGTYSALLIQKYGAVGEADFGHTFRTRDNSHKRNGKGPGLISHSQPLAKWTPRYAGMQFAKMSTAVKGGMFLANTSDEGWCNNVCDLSAHCYAAGGELSAQSDPDHPDYALRP
ncbi:PD-(D/E)XK nuclease family protein [Streptomyces johnsoniae]|uniref:PD-(D/E)XK nuclease family protein n=1 Tax=Streptomyces johnsoniae TaxID=3075532 RepID=A0ABU2S0Y1_9ACTN|nr:PD-(D/E)XK nuclease family protein [Streptomyces sp. DSM 41886]MDT0442351.1 PD-(D/E)XK nuclease family protein [Streptomyces sp. DSM 41886]